MESTTNLRVYKVSVVMGTESLNRRVLIQSPKGVITASVTVTDPGMTRELASQEAQHLLSQTPGIKWSMVSTVTRDPGTEVGSEVLLRSMVAIMTGA